MMMCAMCELYMEKAKKGFNFSNLVVHELYERIFVAEFIIRISD